MPWTEVHINADGVYHTCGTQKNTISNTALGQKYNVHTMSIPGWINSEYQRRARLEKLNGITEPLCTVCYDREALGHDSKRIKENLKSGIVDANFDKTYESSPDLPQFQYSDKNEGRVEVRPNYDNIYSYHISLGNECNMACRMCGPTSSSKVALLEKQAGRYTGPTRMNWTDNQQSWDHVVSWICDSKNLKFVHLIGGEPLINPRFEELIDELLAAGQTDIYLGFTTNGMKFSWELMNKLDAFRHVDVGISIDCAGKLNDYVRHGGSTQMVLDNVDKYLEFREKGHVFVAARPTPSALSIHTLDELYKWCIGRELNVVSNILGNPPYLQIQNLPLKIKSRLLDRYRDWRAGPAYTGGAPIHPHEPERYREHIDKEIVVMINALQRPNNPRLTAQLYARLEEWKWFEDEEIRNYFFLKD